MCLTRINYESSIINKINFIHNRKRGYPLFFFVIKYLKVKVKDKLFNIYILN